MRKRQSFACLNFGHKKTAWQGGFIHNIWNICEANHAY